MPLSSPPPPMSRQSSQDADFSLYPEGLTWLQASRILDDHADDDDVFSANFRAPHISRRPATPPLPCEQKSLPPTPSRTEWIFRRPKPSPRIPPALPRTFSNEGASRTRGDRSPSVLKTIPSESQIILTPTDLPSVDFPRSVKVHTRPPSIESSTSSTLSTPTSSRSESPVALGAYHRSSHHRRHASQPNSTPLSSSYPNKSILTRSPSISTRASSQTANKSVKFAAAPVVHYASTAHWDFDRHGPMEDDGTSSHHLVDEMNVDDTFDEYRAHVRRNPVKVLDIARFREIQATPERERHKRKEPFKRLTNVSKKTALPTTSTDTLSLPQAELSRPAISMPYQLGSVATSQSASQSTTSLRSTRSISSSKTKRGHHSASISGFPSLRTVPSVESIRSARSAKSTTAKSVRSMTTSLKSSASTRGFRAWLNKTLGWADDTV